MLCYLVLDTPHAANVLCLRWIPEILTLVTLYLDEAEHTTVIVKEAFPFSDLVFLFCHGSCERM